MSEINPYAPPLADTQPQVYAAKLSVPNGMWANGSTLVMRRDAQFPNRCVKSNEPAVDRLKRNLSWHHPAIAVAILAGLLIYVLLALILTKRATIHVPLSEQWFRRRRNAITIGWGVALLGLAMFIGAFFLPREMSFSILMLILGGIVVAIGGWAYGGLMSRIVWPSKIDDQFIHLRGVNKEILAALPAWNGQ